MKFEKTVTLKDGRSCVLRNATAADAEEVCRTFRLTHSETDFLLSYPDEITMEVEKEGAYLYQRKKVITR